MISRSETSLIRSLSRKKFRDSEGLFVVEGEKLVQEALDSGYEVVKIFRTSDIGEDAMARITMLSSPSPVLAVVRQKPRQEPPEPGNDLVLALDSVRDPGNMGTIIRIADWFGIKDIAASEDCVEIYNPKVVQATMGAIFRVNVSYCNLEKYIREVARPSGVPIYGTFLEGDNIYTADLHHSGVIVMGSESNGISYEVEALVSSKIHIPSFAGDRATSESLNVAVATAITCSEFRRRGTTL
ncbi:MAG: RNA methyltransferase [Bacteroidales bacterium]|nr:RNA methyltransferase [Candidatus Cacconaster merdequi]